MAINSKRKDNKGRILREGEQQRADGRYMFSYLDPLTNKRKFEYSWKLEPHDKVPVGKKDGLSLREKEKIIESQMRDGIDYQAGKITVLQLVERYTNQKRGVRQTTRNGYKTVINLLAKDPFGQRMIGEVKISDAKLWLIGLQDKGKSYSSLQSIRGVLRPAFQMAADDDMIRKNVFDFELSSVLINDTIRREALTEKQERAFLKFIKDDEHFSQYYDGMYILFNTGLRIGEFCGLTLKDIDLKNRTINVDHQLQVATGKGAYIEETKTQAGTRVLPMKEDVYEAFKRVISGRRKPKIEYMIDGYSGFLFLDKNDKPMRAYQWEKKFQHAVQKYNKIYKNELPKITPHICRHTYCTKMAKKQLSAKTLQYLMGHADINTTMNVYTHIKMEDAKNELDKLDQLENARKELSS